MNDKSKINNKVLLVQIIVKLDIATYRKILKDVECISSRQKREFQITLEWIWINLKENNVLEFKELFKYVFGNIAFDKGKLRSLLSRVLKQVEISLVSMETHKDSLMKEFMLSKFYLKKGIHKGYKIHIERLLKLTNTGTNQYSSYAYKHKLWNLQYLNNLSEKRNSSVSILKMTGNQEAMLTLELLRSYCILGSNKINQESLFLNACLEITKQGTYDNYPLIKAYYYNYLCIKNDEDIQSYHSFKQVFDNFSVNFPDEDRRNLILHLINYCVIQYNKGQKEFLQQIFDLYKTGLQNKSLLEEGKISRWTFQNVVSIGLLMGEMNWIEAFIHAYSQSISVENKGALITYSLSKLFYKQGNFKKAILHLQSIDSKDIEEVLNAKALLMRIFYEEKEWQALENLLTSFYQYTSRQKIRKFKKESFLNLIRFSKQLMNFQINKGNNLNAILQRIEKTNYVIDKAWLREQALQLKTFRDKN